LSAELR